MKMLKSLKQCLLHDKFWSVRYSSAGNKKYDQKRLKQVEGWFVITKLEIWVQASEGQHGHSSGVFKDSSGCCVPDLLYLSYSILSIGHNTEPPPLNISGF